MTTANTSNRQPVVIGVGEILWDMLPTGRHFGGAPVNFAYHAAQCGAVVHAVSAVGDDPLGWEILRRMDDLGIGRQHVAVDPTHKTGMVTVDLDIAGKPQYFIHEDVAWDYIPTTRTLFELAQGADAVCFGTLAQRSPVSRRTILDLLAAVPKNCLRVFDINLRLEYYSAEVLEAGLRNCDVLKLSDEELPVLARLVGVNGNEPSSLESLLERYTLKLIALTKGSDGSILLDGNGCRNHEGVPAVVVDTVGAGDAFTAAVTMGLMHGDNLDAISDHANRLASYVCGQNGAMPAMPKGGLLRVDPLHDALNRSSKNVFDKSASSSQIAQSDY
jgi:fructokinase